MSQPTQPVVIARFGRSHGVKGWVHVQSYTDPAPQCLNYSDWQLQDNQQSLTITDSKQHAKSMVVKIDGFDTPEDVRERLTNRLVVIDREQLKQLGDDEGYYWHDLIGCTVSSQDGTPLGTIDSLFNTAANDVAVVIQDKRERLIPWLDHVIVNVDLASRHVVVDWDPDF